MPFRPLEETMQIIRGILFFVFVLIGSGGAVAQESLVYYDMTPLGSLNLSDPDQRRRYWDETHFVVSLQGLVNRDAPRLYLRYNSQPDDFWWDEIRAEGAWLAGREIINATNLESLVARFSGAFEGAVVWDDRVPATSNLASSFAGIENLVCVRYDVSPESLYTRFVASGIIPEARRLLNPDGSPMFTGSGTIPGTSLASTGSIKCDPYIWLIENTFKQDKGNPTVMGNYLDYSWFPYWNRAGAQNHTLTNHDYVIARGGLFFDLHVWDDEAPIDDPTQPLGADVTTLKRMLRAAYDKTEGQAMIHVAGFTPWAYKYTSHGQAGGSHDPVPTEWKYAEILSCFNAYMDADALGFSAMANASFFQHSPLAEVIPQNTKPTRTDVINRGLLAPDGRVTPKKYIAHYVGDYDAAAWLYWNLPRVWTDGARGEVPLNWAFNPNLADRFPFGMLWSRQSRTPNDFFVAGDSGAGYLNPGWLSPNRPHSGLPSGMAVWEQHNQKYFDQWDLSLVGFIIEGNGPELRPEGYDAYARFSPDGIVAQKVPQIGMHNGMPMLRMKTDLPDSERNAAQTLLATFDDKDLQFVVARSILKAPSWYRRVGQELDRLNPPEYEIVDLYTMMLLAKEYIAHPAENQPGPSPYAHLREISGEPNAATGVRVVRVSDGDFEVDGEFWKVTTQGNDRYLYFSLDDDFTEGEMEFEIEVKFLDSAAGSFLLQYDSQDPTATLGGAYKDGARTTLTGNGTVRTAKMTVRDARFSNLQNNGADLRFYIDAPEFCVLGITVRKLKFEHPSKVNLR